jgi:hypothetical protein
MNWFGQVCQDQSVKFASKLEVLGVQYQQKTSLYDY